LADVAPRLGPVIGIKQKRIKASRLKRSGSSCTISDKKAINNQESKQKPRHQTTRKSPSQICVSPQKTTAKQQENGAGAQQKTKPTHTICH
jgi:formate dehydrogenase assembly factor FdhD